MVGNAGSIELLTFEREPKGVPHRDEVRRSHCGTREEDGFLRLTVKSGSRFSSRKSDDHRERKRGVDPLCLQPFRELHHGRQSNRRGRTGRSAAPWLELTSTSPSAHKNERYSNGQRGASEQQSDSRCRSGTQRRNRDLIGRRGRV